MAKQLWNWTQRVWDQICTHEIPPWRGKYYGQAVMKQNSKGVGSNLHPRHPTKKTEVLWPSSYETGLKGCGIKSAPIKSHHEEGSTMAKQLWNRTQRVWDQICTHETLPWRREYYGQALKQLWNWTQRVWDQICTHETLPWRQKYYGQAVMKLDSKGVGSNLHPWNPTMKREVLWPSSYETELKGCGIKSAPMKPCREGRSTMAKQLWNWTQSVWDQICTRSFPPPSPPPQARMAGRQYWKHHQHTLSVELKQTRGTASRGETTGLVWRPCRSESNRYCQTLGWKQVQKLKRLSQPPPPNSLSISLPYGS